MPSNACADTQVGEGGKVAGAPRLDADPIIACVDGVGARVGGVVGAGQGAGTASAIYTYIYA